MGAEAFATKQRAKTAQDAFDLATSDARYMHGAGGYTGTIAEKHEYRMVTLPSGMCADAFVERALNFGYYPLTEPLDPQAHAAIETASRIAEDKWGPAACFEVPGSEVEGTREFAFFGWASS